MIQEVPEKEISEQRASCNALLQSRGQATAGELAAVLDEREPAEPEAELTPDVVERLRRRLAS